jgi:hypothetical protein
LLDRQGTIPDESLAASILTHQVFLSTCWLKPVVRESLLYLHGDCPWPVRSTSLALAIAPISSAVAKRGSYPWKAPAALGTRWRTQPSGTAGRTNRGFLAPCPPNPQVYPAHQTTCLSRRRGVLPPPAQATAISASPFLFLPTVEFLVYDSAYQFSNRNTLFLGNLFQRRFLRFRKIDVCSCVSHVA